VPNVDARSPSDVPLLLDRAEERAAIDRVIGEIATGLSGACVLSGDAGMGKTRLLEYAVDSAPQLRSVWISGVEAEKELGYAGLHRLLRPYLARRDQLPEPQRAALESAFGMHVGAPADRFLVGLACLSLLADVASERGLLCIVDDAQWIDRESVEALSFVARRLAADGIGLLFGVRDVDLASGVFDELPLLNISGLPDDASLELLSASIETAIDPTIARHIVLTTSGCPLALIELAKGLTQEQLRGGYRDGDALPLGRQLEEHFLRQVHELAPAAQLFLLVAAAESSGDPVLVRRAAFRLGADDEAEDGAIASGLIAIRPNVVFRHPLVRAAVYAGAPRSLRDTVHETLAALIDRTDPDRRVRHLSAAAREPDEAIALELEQAGLRAGRRGGYAAEASFVFEAAHLSAAPAERSRRLLLAATAALNAGLPQRAEALLEQARPDLQDPLLEIEAIRLDGRLRVPLADPPSAPARLLAAARAIEPFDARLARESFVEALEACVVSQQFTVDVGTEEVARAALATVGGASNPPTLLDMLLTGTASLFIADFAHAMPVLRDVARVLRDGPVDRGDIARWFNLGLAIANELWDETTHDAWADRVEESARATGALILLQVALLGRAKRETRRGRFTAAEMTYDEVVEITRMLGGPPAFYELLKADLYAWRGQEPETRAAAAALRDAAVAIGSAPGVDIADLAVATLDLGLGHYAQALAAVEPLVLHNQPGWTCLALAIAVEAAVRADRPDRAAQYLAQLGERASAADTTWARGQLARCRALLAEDDLAEDFYVESITLLSMTSVRTELAQAQLAYGEWLRRQNRRVDARSQLRIAYDAFAVMGAEGFATRARSELSATGEKIARRSVGTGTDLTSQESQAARLAAGGATNAEIASRMFISANTVDYHLRKVYRKLGISSRRELARAIPPLDPREAERSGA
jgi:DNA-binding CsgD family transcriptional regulator